MRIRSFALQDSVPASTDARDAWRVVSDAGCVGRLDQLKETVGYYEVPFAFEAVLK